MYEKIFSSYSNSFFNFQNYLYSDILPQFDSLKFNFNTELNQNYYHWLYKSDTYFDRFQSIKSGQGYFDNPILHGAYQVGLHFNSTYGEKENFKLEVAANMECRGWSYGLLNTKNIVVYPEFVLSYLDTLSLGKKKLIPYLKLGNFFNDSIDGSPYFYNINWMGTRLRLDYESYYLEYNEIADLSYWIGMNISELYSIKLGKIHTFKDSVSLFNISSTLNFLEEIPLNANTTAHQINPMPGLIISYKNKRSIKYLLSVSFPEIQNLKKQYYDLAAVIEYHNKRKKHELKTSLSAKYFHSIEFMQNHFYQNVHYKEWADSTTVYFGNSVGNFLYPLKNYWIPSSQWMMYNELAATSKRNTGIFGLEFYLNFESKLYKNLYNKIEIELIGIYRTKYDGHKEAGFKFYYSDYLFYKISSDLRAGIYITNKLMNIDNCYQTFYQSVYPYFGFTIQKLAM